MTRTKIKSRVTMRKVSGVLSASDEDVATILTPTSVTGRKSRDDCKRTLEHSVMHMITGDALIAWVHLQKPSLMTIFHLRKQ